MVLKSRPIKLYNIKITSIFVDIDKYFIGDENDIFSNLIVDTQFQVIENIVHNKDL
jgi:hypothetical protein